MTDPLPPGDDHQDLLAHGQGMGRESLLDLLERLDGAEEAEVVRSAVAAGVPDAVVLEELRREVERRLLRTRAFYDQTDW